MTACVRNKNEDHLGNCRARDNEDVAAKTELLEDLGRIGCATFFCVPWKIQDVDIIKEIVTRKIPP